MAAAGCNEKDSLLVSEEDDGEHDAMSRLRGHEPLVGNPSRFADRTMRVIWESFGNLQNLTI